MSGALLPSTSAEIDGLELLGARVLDGDAGLVLEVLHGRVELDGIGIDERPGGRHVLALELAGQGALEVRAGAGGRGGGRRRRAGADAAAWSAAATDAAGDGLAVLPPAGGRDEGDHAQRSDDTDSARSDPPPSPTTGSVEPVPRHGSTGVIVGTILDSATCVETVHSTGRRPAGRESSEGSSGAGSTRRAAPTPAPATQAVSPRSASRSA